MYACMHMYVHSMHMPKHIREYEHGDVDAVPYASVFELMYM